MSPLRLACLCVFIAACTSGADSETDTKAADEARAAKLVELKALEDKNPETWLVFHSKGPHKKSVTMRCILKLGDDFSSASPLADRRICYSLSVANLDGSVAFHAYIRKADAGTEEAGLISHLKDGKAHFAIADFNVLSDREGTIMVTQVSRWDSWDD